MYLFFSVGINIFLCFIIYIMSQIIAEKNKIIYEYNKVKASKIAVNATKIIRKKDNIVCIINFVSIDEKGHISLIGYKEENQDFRETKFISYNDLIKDFSW